MAEPIRKPIHPLHRAPLHRPRLRQRQPLPAASRAGLRIAEDLPAPPQAAPPRRAAAPALADEPRALQRPSTGTWAPAREKRLRLALEIAILLHIAALLPFLLSPRTAPALPDVVLATAVLLAGGGVLTIGRRR